VAIGVAADTAYSACAGLLDEGLADRVIRVLRELGLPTTHEFLADSDAVMAGLEEFREHLGGQLTITLLRGIGSPVDVHAMDAAMLKRALALASRAS
jgi:3-dehydroquinate synthase